MKTSFVRILSVSLVLALIAEPSVSAMGTVSRPMPVAKQRVRMSCFDTEALSMGNVWALQPLQGKAAKVLLSAAAVGGLTAAVDTSFVDDLSFPGSFHFLNGAALFVIVMGSIVVHEVAHGWAALKRGDITARMLGLITWKPWRFLNFFTSTLMLVTAYLAFPLTAFHTRLHPRFGEDQHRATLAKIALAGPLATILLGGDLYLVTVFLRDLFPVITRTPWANALSYQFILGSYINMYLGVLNLMPLSFLDGYRIFRVVAPARQVQTWDSVSLTAGTLIMLTLLGNGLYDRLFQSNPVNAVDHVVHSFPSGHGYFEGMMVMCALMWGMVSIPAMWRAVGQFVQFRNRVLNTINHGSLITIGMGYTSEYEPFVTQHVYRKVPIPLRPGQTWRDSLNGRYRIALPREGGRFSEDMHFYVLGSGEKKPASSMDVREIWNGQYLLLENLVPSEKPFLCLLPAEYVGGPVKAKKLMETSQLLDLTGGRVGSQNLLSRDAVDTITALSDLLRMPVYDVDENLVNSKYRVAYFAVDKKERSTFYLQTAVLNHLATLDAEERALRLIQVFNYLQAIRTAIEGQGSFEEAHEEFLRGHPSFAEWLAEIPISEYGRTRMEELISPVIPALNQAA